MSKADLDRRTFLGTAGTTAVTILAGCTGAAPNNQAADGTATAASEAEHTESGHGHEEDSHHETEGHGEAEAHHEDEEHHDEETATDHHEEAEHHEGEETHTEGGHSGGGPFEHATVNMQTTSSGQHFHPHVAWVEPGGTVTFVNESGTHTATAYHPDNDKPQRVPDGAEPFDSGLLTEEGATWEHTFETEGVYDVYCEPHEQLGMIGTVVVGKPDPHDQPGLADPQSEMSGEVASKVQRLNEQVNTMLGHEH
ncbi:cupredoxin domain-containing protein [Salinigranum marinum]|uniref:cupredoxin domain-containing protein n=1 Tax=Salinigranum marinum TaxID=1515595 RepID=UPI002989D96E|nr:plastocyanin/azurin family copper-binding protein [Salinigranum marinum]